MQVHLKGGKQSLVWLKHRERKENPSIRRNYKEKEELTINDILMDGKSVGYKVNGKRMIDTIIDALHENGIFEIYVVVGYKKEQFYEWAEGKEGIKII